MTKRSKGSKHESIESLRNHSLCATVLSSLNLYDFNSLEKRRKRPISREVGYLLVRKKDRNRQFQIKEHSSFKRKEDLFATHL